MELFETECFFVITKREMVIYTYICHKLSEQQLIIHWHLEKRLTFYPSYLHEIIVLLHFYGLS